MSLFDSDVEFHDENSDPAAANRMSAAAKPRRQTTQTKRIALEMDSSDGDFSIADEDDDDDFEAETPKPKQKAVKTASKTTMKANISAKTLAKPPAKPRAKPAGNGPNKRQKTSLSEPLKSVENQLVDSIVADDSSTSLVEEPVSEAPSVPGSAKKSKGNASSQYQKLTQLEHILKRPDTYIGSVEHTESKMWVFDRETSSMVYKTVSIVPGLYKIFDEILVNAADNKIRDSNMDTLKVEIDLEKNLVSIYNNGRGIPIEIHEKEKMYIPELIFGNLLTSSNYDDNQKKVTGGRNGYGAKVSS